MALRQPRARSPMLGRRHVTPVCRARRIPSLARVTRGDTRRVLLFDELEMFGPALALACRRKRSRDGRSGSRVQPREGCSRPIGHRGRRDRGAAWAVHRLMEKPSRSAAGTQHEPGRLRAGQVDHGASGPSRTTSKIADGYGGYYPRPRGLRTGKPI
jgi:hypothetical protein